MKRHPTLTLAALSLAGLCGGHATAAEGGDGASGQEGPKQATHAASEAGARVGDPYPLSSDPVTGQSLAGADELVILLHEGRELRFADLESVEKFKADPQKVLDEVDESIIQSQMPYDPMMTCPISGEKLGGEMGEPVDFVHGNRLIRFCCNDCRAAFLEDPSAALEKLDAAVISQQKEAYPLETCPVTGFRLGSMGEPADVTIANRLVRLCCVGCKGEVMANPAKVLAEIDAAWKESGASPSAAAGRRPRRDGRGPGRRDEAWRRERDGRERPRTTRRRGDGTRDPSWSGRRGRQALNPMHGLGAASPR